ncbi:MAG: pyridoxal-phosphate dependent enzyme, partial [Chloroflexi bacterium]
GNTSASAAAYAARCGLRAVVVVPAGGVAAGKLAQALAYGATILTVTGSFDIALRLVRQLAGEPGVALVNSVNPFRIEGQKTAAFEIVEQLGDAPARLFIPVGNGGNITAYWRGFTELHQRDARSRPAIHGAQAEGAAPLVRGRPVVRPRTREEGLLVEPASAAGVALLIKNAGAGRLGGDGAIVCVLTGHGLKDPQALTHGLRLPRPVRPTLSTLLRAIG